MTPKGTLAIVGGEGGGKVLGGFGRLLLAPMASLFVGQTYCAVTAHERLAELEELVALVESGAVVPHVGRAYPLACGRGHRARTARGQGEGQARRNSLSRSGAVRGCQSQGQRPFISDAHQNGDPKDRA